jgi:hypothetical protein
MIDWSTVAQIVTITSTAVYYGGRFISRLETVERSLSRIEVRVDELAGRLVEQPPVVVPEADPTRSERGRTADQPRKAKAS